MVGEEIEMEIHNNNCFAFIKRIYRLFLLIIYMYVLSINFKNPNISSFSPIFSYHFNIYSVTLIGVNILIGLMLGIENIFKEKLNKGSWKFRMKRFLVVSIPVLYFSFEVYLSYSFNSIFLVRVLFIPFNVIVIIAVEYYGLGIEALRFFLLFGYFSQVLFGYLVSKSIYKA